MGFRCGGGRGDGDSDESFDEPNGEPSTWGGLACSEESGGESGDAHGDPTPSWDGRELGCALHGFADVFEMVGGASVDGYRFAFGGAERASGRHDERLPRESDSVKYFVSQSRVAAPRGYPRFG